MPGLGGLDVICRMTPYKRRRAIEKYVEQREKEFAEVEKARNKQKH